VHCESIIESAAGEGVDGNGLFESPDQHVAFRLKAEARIGSGGVANGFGNRDGRGFRLTAEACREVDIASNRGVVEMLGRAEVADHGTAGVDPDAKTADLFVADEVFNAGAIENTQCAETALSNHVGAVEERHHA